MLSEYLNIDEGGVSVLEEQIDSDTQMEYFEYSRGYENKFSKEEAFRNKELIFHNDISLERKKDLLVQLASIKDVEAYRTIERYLREPSSKLYEWAYLALQESKLLLESHILEESKVLITTGLGGKGLKIRYFIVFFTGNSSLLTPLQQKIITSELQYASKHNDTEIEDIIFEEGFASILALVPIQVSVREMFYKINTECNQFGNFLFHDFIITNLKVLSIEEIKELLAINNLI